MKAFFGAKQKKSHGERASYSALNGYRNAIKAVYVKNDVCKEDHELFDKVAMPFLQGYQKKVVLEQISV